jgi:hypothetical protein
MVGGSVNNLSTKSDHAHNASTAGVNQLYRVGLELTRVYAPFSFPLHLRHVDPFLRAFD